MPLVPTVWTPTSGIGEAGNQVPVILLTEDGLELATEDGFSLTTEVATYEGLPSTVWGGTNGEAESTTVYRPTGGIGEAGNKDPEGITTISGEKLVTKDGLRLVTKQGTYTKLASTIWTIDDNE